MERKDKPEWSVLQKALHHHSAQTLSSRHFWGFPVGYNAEKNISILCIHFCVFTLILPPTLVLTYYFSKQIKDRMHRTITSISPPPAQDCLYLYCPWQLYSSVAKQENDSDLSKIWMYRPWTYRVNRSISVFRSASYAWFCQYLHASFTVFNNMLNSWFRGPILGAFIQYFQFRTLHCLHARSTSNANHTRQ